MGIAAKPRPLRRGGDGIQANETRDARTVRCGLSFDRAPGRTLAIAAIAAVDGDRRLAGTASRDHSPNIFCFISRRSCASNESVAVGRASRRGTPIGSPVSSQ